MEKMTTRLTAYVRKSPKPLWRASESWRKTEHSKRKFSRPIVEILSLLPKDELPALAEALVSLTSIKRHFSHDVETVGGRIGWAAGHWMPYVTGGYATARYEDNVRLKAIPNTVTVLGGERHDGWFIGGGFEWAISPGWSTGLEYRHYELDDRIYNRFTPGGAPVPGDRAIVDVGLDTITARVSWRWGRPEAAPLK